MKDELGALHSARGRSSTRHQTGQRHRHRLRPGVGAGTNRPADRNMITNNATGGSGSINTAGYSPQHRRQRPRQPWHHPR